MANELLSVLCTSVVRISIIIDVNCPNSLFVWLFIFSLVEPVADHFVKMMQSYYLSRMY